MTRQRLGLIGGTFDPIHIGHLVIAARAREQLGLDHVVFLPAGLPPHKQDEQHTAARHRLAMTELAITGDPRFIVSDRDMRPDRPAYTVELLRDLAAAQPDADLTFIIGGDSLRDLPRWHQPDEIVHLARLAVAERPDVVAPESVYAQVPGLREAVDWIESPLLEISATDLRTRIAHGRSVRHLIPDSVIAYIAQHRLYRIGE